MMRHGASGSSDAQLNMEAAEWLVLLEDTEHPAGPRQQADFFEWLRRSPRHLKAFFEIADEWRELEGLDARRQVDLEKWLAGGAARVTVVREAPVRARGFGRALRTHWIPIAAAILCAIGAVLWLQLAPQQFSTAVGEQRTFRLDDGSVLELNTRSRVKVRYSSRQRLVELVDGEALFTVEQEATRPFVVRTGKVAVQALGTAFNVLQRPQSTVITVIEGAVQVSRNDKDSVRLDAGEAAEVSDTSLTKGPAAPADTVLAWRERRLVFDNAPLAQVAAEFNRYNSVRIVTEGDVGHTRRITGLFGADHPQSLLIFLQKEPGLTVEHRRGTIVVRERADGD